MTVAWSRPASFGAWVRFGDTLLVAADHALADRLGVPRGDATTRERPLEIAIGVTSRCRLTCEGCYLDASPTGEAPPFEVLAARFAEAAAGGASTVAFGGGEPLERADLGDLARAARSHGLVPVTTTSGVGLTAERAADLGAFAQINVSHDGTGGGYRSVRGFDASAVAERAIETLARAGIAVGVNLVLTRDSFAHVEATAARAAGAGAREIQLLRYKPTGRAATAAYEARRLSAEQVGALWQLVERLAARRDLAVRVDCSMVPLLAPALLARVDDAADTLERFGVLGCEAGRHLGSVDARGAVAGCSFLAPARVQADDQRALAGRFDDDATLERLRALHAALPEPCASCPLASVCRGGCQAVALHALGRLGPDPECPRVIAAS